MNVLQELSYFYFCIIFEGKRFLFTECFGFYIFSTYLLTQYDIQPTRRYHSIMLIHDWLNTGAFSPISPLHYTTNFNVPPGPYLLAHSHMHTSRIHKWLRAQSPIRYPLPLPAAAPNLGFRPLLDCRLTTTSLGPRVGQT